MNLTKVLAALLPIMCLVISVGHVGADEKPRIIVSTDIGGGGSG